MRQYVIEIIPLRRTIHDACMQLFNDTKIALLVYTHIMDQVEDYVSDCEADMRCENDA